MTVTCMGCSTSCADVSSRSKAGFAAARPCSKAVKGLRHFQNAALNACAERHEAVDDRHMHGVQHLLRTASAAA